MDWIFICWKNRNHPISHTSANFTFYILSFAVDDVESLISCWLLYPYNCILLWTFCDLGSKGNDDAPFFITLSEAQKELKVGDTA